jgi:hypothetical protein
MSRVAPRRRSQRPKFAIGDAAVETLATQHADLDLDHVEPVGVLGRKVELISKFS